MDVDVPRLRTIGEKLAAVGPKVGDACTNHKQALVPGGDGASSPWPSIGTTSGAVSKWEAFTGTLKADITGHGNSVVGSANALASTDADAADRTKAAGGVR